MKLYDKRAREIDDAARRRRAGDAAGAVDVLAAILAADPDHVAANAEIARALRVLGDPAGAEEHLRRALELVLDYQLVVELAMSLAEQGRMDEASQSVDAAVFMADRNPRLDPGEALLVRAAIAAAEGRDDDARATLDHITGDRTTRKRSRPTTLTYAQRMRETLSGP